MTTAPAFAPVLRRPTAADLSFVIASWKHGMRKLPEFARVPNERLYRWLDERIARVLRLESTRVLLACDPDAPTDGRLGCVVGSGDSGVLWWYVIQSMRRAGIGRLLWDSVLEERTIGRIPDRVEVPYPPFQLRLPSYARSCQYVPVLWPP